MVDQFYRLRTRPLCHTAAPTMTTDKPDAAAVGHSNQTWKYQPQSSKNLGGAGGGM